MNEQMTIILLVEDEEAHAELVCRAFEAHRERFHLTVASNLAEARAYLAEARPHLIITDLRLPDGLGTDLLPATTEERTIPLVVMTAQGDQAAAVEAMKAGALDYLVKSEEVLADAPHIAERVLREWHNIIERRTAEEKLTVLYDISRILSQSGDFESKATRVMERLAQSVGADWVTLRLPKEGEPGLHLVAVAGPAAAGTPPAPVFTPAQTMGRAAFTEGRTIVIDDYAAQPGASRSNVDIGMQSMVILPLKASELTVGLVTVISKEKSYFTPELVDLLAAVGEGLGVLLENAQLDQQLQTGREELSVVDEVARIFASTLDSETVYDQFAKHLRRLVGFDFLCVLTVDRDAGTIQYQYGFYGLGRSVPGIEVGGVFALGGTRAQLVVETGNTMIQEDITTGTEYRPDPEYKKAGLISCIVVPVVYQGQVFGTINLFSRKVAAFGSREQVLLERLATHMAPAMTNSQLYYQSLKSQQEQNRLARESRLMAEIGRIVGSSLDMNEIFDAFADRVRSLIPYHQLEITVIDQDRERDDVVFSTAISETANWPGGSNPLEGSVTGRVASSRSGLIIQGMDSDEVESENASLGSTFHAGFRSWLVVPIMSRDEPIGAICLSSTTEMAFTEHDLELAEQIANQISGAMANSQLYAERLRLEEAERERSDELAALYEISSVISLPGAFSDKIENVLGILADLSDSEWVTFRIPRDDEPGLHLVGAAGPGVEMSPPLPVFTEEQQMAMSAFRDGEIKLVNDYAAAPNQSPAVLAMGTRSVVLIPLKAGERIYGLVNVISSKPHHFTPEAVRLLTAVGQGLGGQLDKARLDEEHQRAEEQIRASLNEKEVLLKEINHRVKNNLQIISSLLSLQSQDIKDEEALRSFQVSQDRIRAMALVHEKLYQSDDLARIDFGEYIKSLATDLGSSYGLANRDIDLKIDVENILLGVDTAIPCGVIVNELVANSLKHAFPGDRSGEIIISFRESGGHYTMIFKDNGVGLPEDLDISRPPSLGLTIVKALAGQLRGTIGLSRDNGSEISITFPVR